MQRNSLVEQSDTFPTAGNGGTPENILYQAVIHVTNHVAVKSFDY